MAGGLTVEIRISQPDVDAPIFELLKKRWEAVAGEAKLIWYRADSATSHPDLLTRIWWDARKSSDPLQVISEIDFIPNGGLVEGLRACLERIRAILVPYATRDKLDATRIDELWPLIGPWFMAFNLANMKDWPPENWLENTPHIDNPGAAGYLKALQAGFLWPSQVRQRPGEPVEGPRGIWYPHLGLHAFYARHYAEDGMFQLPGLGRSVGLHLEHIKHYLQDRVRL